MTSDDSVDNAVSTSDDWADTLAFNGVLSTLNDLAKDVWASFLMTCYSNRVIIFQLLCFFRKRVEYPPWILVPPDCVHLPQPVKPPDATFQILKTLPSTRIFSERVWGSVTGTLVPLGPLVA